MASIGLSIVGSVIAGPLGAQIGAAVGAVIDSLLFAPKMEGPRLNDLSVTASTFGQGIPLIYGPDNRMGGNIIWSSGLIESSNKHSAKGGPTITEYSYSVSVAIAIGEGEINGIKRIWANNKVIYDSGSFSLMESATIYTGSATQSPDATIEGYLGVGNVPGYRHTAYVVLRNLQLADFGNAIPNFQFEVDGQYGTNVSDWIKDIARRSGLSPLELSTGSLNAQGRGYVIASPTTGWGALEPLSLAFGFEMAEQDTELRCIPRDAGISIVIPLEDMGASADHDGSPPEPIRTETQPPIAMPREVTVSYRDPDLDYQSNSHQTYMRLRPITQEPFKALVSREWERAKRILPLLRQRRKPIPTIGMECSKDRLRRGNEP